MPLVLQQDFDCACLFLCHSIELACLLLSIILPTFYDVYRLAMRATDDSSQGTTAAAATAAGRATAGGSTRGRHLVQLPPAASASIFIDSFRAQTNLLFG